MARSLTLVVSTPAERGDCNAAFALAHAARRADIEVSVFFMSDAVVGLPALQAQLAALRDDDVELMACATSASGYGLDRAACGMWLGSQDDHAALVHKADRVLSFS